MSKRRLLLPAVLIASLLGVGACDRRPITPELAPPPVAPEEPPAAPQGPTGTVAGRVRLVGEPPFMAPLKLGTDPACREAARVDQAVRLSEGSLRDVVVRVLGEVPGGRGASRSAVVLDQRACTYRPRVQGAVAGQTLEIRNSDATLHNVHTFLGKRTLFNLVQRPRAPAVAQPLPDRPEVVRIGCDVHPWMVSWIVVNENPYFVTTAGDGRFELTELPVGTYTVEAWHERFGTRRAEVTVEEGARVELDLAFDARERG